MLTPIIEMFPNKKCAMQSWKYLVETRQSDSILHFLQASAQWGSGMSAFI